MVKDNENLKGVASGTAVSINDASPIQHDVKISVSSKNMLDAPNLVFHNNDIDADFKVEGNSFTIRGMKGTSANHVSSGQLSFPTISINSTVYPVNIVTHGIPVIENKTYTISFDYLLLEQGEWENNSVQFIVYYADLSTPLVKNDQVLGEIGVVKHYSFVFNPKKTDKIGINFRLNNNYVTISNIQIEEGTTATSYTPYTEDFSGATITVGGKNLFDVEVLLNKIANKEGTVNNASYYVVAMQFKPNTQYYLKCNGQRNGSIFLVSSKYETSSSISSGISINDGGWKSERAITTDETGNIYFGAVGGVAPNVNTVRTQFEKAMLQIEQGSTATEYEPYHKETFISNPTDENGITIIQNFKPMKGIPKPGISIIPNNESLTISSVEYIKDIDKAYNELINQIALSGGE